MKLSLDWIFEHINADWHTYDIADIITKFNKTTAEIEHSYELSFDVSNIYLARILHNNNDICTVFIPETNKQVILPLRNDTSNYEAYFMIKDNGGNGFSWVSLDTFNLDYTALVPAFSVATSELNGTWRRFFQDIDIILDVDNKSITHRPDMWGHRGFAREIAAFMHIKMHNEASFLHTHSIKEYHTESVITEKNPIHINKLPNTACINFTGFYATSILNKPSDLWIASRLIKIGARPINSLVDLSNYVMFDISAPTHVYDTEKISGDLKIRTAREGELLSLLGGNTISLTTSDTIIADDQDPLCLAGIKGGTKAAVTENTHTILFEAASWDAGFVRKTAQRHKIRTDASARFEKTLDPAQPIKAAQRFLFLASKLGILGNADIEIFYIGSPFSTHTIEIEHSFFEKRTGMIFQPSQITTILERLEFNITMHYHATENIVYTIDVPSFRASKDVKIKEDVLEEFIRSFGFEHITQHLPAVTRTPFDMQKIDRLYDIKCFFAYTMHMIEQQNYALYDETFLKTITYNPDTNVYLLNPVSENFYRMITSLIPGLLKNIYNNHIHKSELSFFECGRLWHAMEDKTIQEKTSIAGIILKKRGIVDFYTIKSYIIQLLRQCGIDSTKIQWQTKINNQSLYPWYNESQAAYIMYNGINIGLLGKADISFLNRMNLDAKADACIFEIDGDWILTEKSTITHYKPLSKYQETYIDLCFLIPTTLTMAIIQQELSHIDPFVCRVDLLDVFDKVDTKNNTIQSRSMTFRLWLVDMTRTLEKGDIEKVWHAAVEKITQYGGELRTQ